MRSVRVTKKRSDRPTVTSSRRPRATLPRVRPPRGRAAQFTPTRGLVTVPERPRRARLQARIEGDLGARAVRLVRHAAVSRGQEEDGGTRLGIASPLGILGMVQRREAIQIIDGEGGAHGW